MLAWSQPSNGVEDGFKDGFVHKFKWDSDDHSWDFMVKDVVPTYVVIGCNVWDKWESCLRAFVHVKWVEGVAEKKIGFWLGQVVAAFSYFKIRSCIVKKGKSDFSCCLNCWFTY